MSIEITVPDLGDGIDSGDVLSVLVEEGDTVDVEQGIVELETDKAVAEVPSTHAGRVEKIHVKTGQSVEVGATLITLQEVEAGTEDESPQKPKASEQPESSEGKTAAEVPATDAPEKPKTTPAKKTEPKTEPKTAPAPAAAVKQTTQEIKAQTPAKAPPPASADGNRTPAPAGPSVRRFAREVGVDLSRVSGSGHGGRITRDDVLAAVRSSAAAPRTPQSEPAAGAEAPVEQRPAEPTKGVPGEPGNDDWGPVHVDRVSKIRATIARNMVQSKSTAPHVTNFDDADVTELEQIRQSSKSDYAAKGVKLTTMPFVMKAVAEALRRHPVINASIDLDAGQIIYKRYVNVGVAVDTERGLMVPVVRDADRMSIAHLARALAELAEKARTNRITIDDMRGGTFTISNLGAIGGTYSTPVINVPEVAILLIGRSREMPVVVDGEIEPRLMMPLSLSYDHRMVDGAAAARFLNEVKGYLEAPGRLLLAP